MSALNAAFNTANVQVLLLIIAFTGNSFLPDQPIYYQRYCRGNEDIK